MAKTKKTKTLVTKQQNRIPAKVLIGVLTIFYLVGIVGLALESTHNLFLRLSPFHLLLTFLVLALGREGKKDLFTLYAFLLFFLGMLIEIIGTQSGMLFGSYAYGTILGPAFFGVPLIIGVNWATLVIACSSWTVGLQTAIWKKTLLASAGMTLLDLFIEPVAVDFDFWHWKGGDIPLFNYLCWFALSYPMCYLYLKWKLAEDNAVAKAIAVLMLVFFVVLNML